MADELLISHDDERFAAVHAAARVLFDEALKMEGAAPGEESGQAAHYGFTALMNVARIEEGDVPNLLGAMIGTTLAAMSDPSAALEETFDSALHFIRQSLQRVEDIKADVAGNA